MFEMSWTAKMFKKALRESILVHLSKAMRFFPQRL
jgi:hypothetical protein